MTTIGTRIRQLRKEAGYTTGTSFAKALGVAPSRLSEWEKSRYKTPSMATLKKIADTLGKKVDDFFPEKNDLGCPSSAVDSANQRHQRRVRSQPDDNPSEASADSSRRLEYALSELQEAVLLFQDLAAASAEWNARASEWIKRLIDLQIAPIEQLAGRQAPVGRDVLPGVHTGRGADARPADRARRRKRPA